MRPICPANTPRSKQIRLQLAAVIRGVISQRLIPRADGKGRVPAVEVCVATATVRECVVDSDKTRQLHDVIAAGVTPYQVVQRSIAELGAERIVGTVLNRVDPTSLEVHEYYGGYYGGRR